MKVFLLLSRSCLDFFRDNGLMLAGSLSYFMMMALVPFFLFLITVFGHLLGQYPEMHRFLLAKLVSFSPSVTREITDYLTTIITYKGLGTFSLVLYGLLSYQVFASVENALNAIFKVKKRRRFVVSVLVSLVVVTLIIALLIISFAAASVIPVLKTLAPAIPGIKIGRITKFLLQFVLPFSLILCSTMLVYILVPKTKVRFLSALTGAFFTTSLLEIAKYVFAWYVSSVAQFGKIYGPLTAFILFLLWLFYSSCIFLIGGEIVHNLGNQKRIYGGS